MNKSLRALLLTALVVSTAAQALTPDEAADALALTKHASPLCDSINQRYPGIGSYQEPLPFFLVRDSKLAVIETVRLLGPIGTFGPYSDQTWTMKPNDFATLELRTPGGVSPVKFITFYFDLHDRFKTDICIRTTELK